MGLGILPADLPQTTLIVMFVPKTTPVLLISTAIAPSTFLREQAEGTETSQPIAFTLEHWSLAASPGGSAST